MENWIAFYAPFFPDRPTTETWVARCEALRHTKVMMHQAQRLITFADELPTIRRNVEPLQLMFLLMCAENVAKLHDKYVGEVCSRKYVHCFFERFVIGDDRRMMEQAFTDNNDHLLRPLSFKQVVNVLYDVRCDVVHEGNYQDFAFHDGAMPMVNVAPDITANISLADLRAVLVRGCINAVNDRLNTPIS